MPTVWRRYFASARRVERGDVEVAERDAARGRAQDAAEARQQRRLPAAARAEQDRQRAGGHLEVEPVDRPHGVAAARVLDDEVVDVRGSASVTGLRTPSAGSTAHRTTQPRDARQRGRSAIAISRQQQERRCRHHDAHREHRREDERQQRAEHGGDDRDDDRLQRKPAEHRTRRRRQPP